MTDKIEKPEKHDVKLPQQEVIQIGDLLVGSQKESLEDVKNTAINLLKNKKVKEYLADLKRSKLLGTNYFG